MYPSLLVFLDDAPRPAAKLAEITPLLRAVKQASTILGELSDGARQDIGKARVRGTPKGDPRWTALTLESNNSDIPRLNRVIKDLKDFIPQLEKARAYLKTCSSQGGKIKQARSVLTAQLTGLFNKYFNSILEDTRLGNYKWNLSRPFLRLTTSSKWSPTSFPSRNRPLTAS